MLALGLAAVLGACAGGDPQGRYRFDVLDQPVDPGGLSHITVQITDTSTGAPVDGATISDASLSMRAPTIAAPGKSIQPERADVRDVEVVGPAGPGQYKLVGDVPRPGTWKLDLAANVPGEPAKVEGQARFVASSQRDDP